MTDKKHTLLVILDSPDVSEEAKKLMDALVKDGNTQMLALRKASLSEQFGLFEAITSLSQASPSSDLAMRFQHLSTQTRESVSRIEMSFFGDGKPRPFSKLFHRPIKAGLVTEDEDLAKHASSLGLEPIALSQFQEPLMIMSCQMKPGKEEMAMLPELLILHIHELKTKEDIDVIETLRASGLFTIQFVLGPVPIDSSVLLPGPLPFARPKQSFERFGPLEFTMDEICNDHALVVIENDKDYCRVDSLGSYAELISVLEELKQPGTSRRLFGSCQLADTLMKQIGFKLGKVDKFGA